MQINKENILQIIAICIILKNIKTNIYRKVSNFKHTCKCNNNNNKAPLP